MLGIGMILTPFHNQLQYVALYVCVIDSPGHVQECAWA